MGAVVWADGQLAPAQLGLGPLRSPGGPRDGVLRAAVGNILLLNGNTCLLVMFGIITSI